MCPNCGHLLGNELPNTSAYYESDYRILLDHEDEDQIYEIRDQEIVYRTDHQVATLLDKLKMPEGALLLDYGCAKASTPKRLLAYRADVQVHLFDVSEMYVPYWNSFVSADRWAVHQSPEGWRNHFDVVTSFFALEHIPDPKKAVLHIADLLSEHGVFYGIVPDTFGNVADFVVIDHVNHFTTASLNFLLKSAGFKSIHIDSSVHRGALVFVASKQGTEVTDVNPLEVNERARGLARYWARVGRKVRSVGRAEPNGSAIYGSGFYGAFIYSTLADPVDIACFLDRSPYQQGKTLFGKPILAPDQLPGGTDRLYIGLNPAIARESMAGMHWPADLMLIYLDEEPQ